MKAYGNKFKEYKVFQSKSRRGSCSHNFLMENFFGLLRQKIFHGKLITVSRNRNQQSTAMSITKIMERQNKY